jgi:hypothetical protein
MTVYRYEDEKGFGPFQAPKLRRAYPFGDWMYFEGNNMPVPFMDGVEIPPRSGFSDWYEWKAVTDHRNWDEFYTNGNKGEKDIVFAFANKRQAQEYFGPKARNLFERYGIQLKAYQVPKDKVSIGGHQVAFVRGDIQKGKEASA